MKKIKISFGIGLLLLTFYTCKVISGSVRIGKQVWSTKNLDVCTFNNGDTIPEVKTMDEWHKMEWEGKPAWCYYDNKQSNGIIYGRLYNWFVVNDSRGIAPEGWHVPNYDEWNVLVEYLGGASVAGDKLRSKTGWVEGKYDFSGNDTSKFSALPGGESFFGHFENIGSAGNWWSSTEYDSARVWTLEMFARTNLLRVEHLYKGEGFSIRCIKNK